MNAQGANTKLVCMNQQSTVNTELPQLLPMPFARKKFRPKKKTRSAITKHSQQQLTTVFLSPHNQQSNLLPSLTSLASGQDQETLKFQSLTKRNIGHKKKKHWLQQRTIRLWFPVPAAPEGVTCQRWEAFLFLKGIEFCCRLNPHEDFTIKNAAMKISWDSMGI